VKYWIDYRSIDQWDRIERTKTNLYMDGSIDFLSGCQGNLMGKSLLKTGGRNVCYHVQKNEFRSLSHTIYQ
jgi:hypothetical protein